MKLRGMAGLVAVLIISWWGAGCGDYFRPVANPITPPLPDPQAQRTALVLYQGSTQDLTAPCVNGSAPPCAGAAVQINVSGDTDMANVYVGRTPVHAVFAAQTSVANEDDDSVSLFTPGITGATPTTIALPSGAKPVFLASAAGSVYVVDSGLNSVSVISPTALSLLNTVAVGNHPVAVASTPDGKKVYVANRDDNTVSVISTVDNTVAAPPINLGAQGDLAPVFVLANPAGTAMYVLNRDSATIAIIDPFSDSVAGHLSLPAGGMPNYMAFDTRLQRLYVTNPAKNSVSIFDASGSPPKPLACKSPTDTVCSVDVGAAPMAVAPLADGSRVYVVNTGETTGCNGETDMGKVSVINTSSNTVTACISVGKNPVWIAASGDGSKLYVPHLGATLKDGSVAIPIGTSVISSATNQVTANVNAPFTNPECSTDGPGCVRMTPAPFALSQ